MVHSTIVIGVFWSYRIGSTTLPSCNFHRSQWPWLPVRKLLETGGYIEKWAILSHTYIDYIRYTYINIYIYTYMYIYVHIVYIYIHTYLYVYNSQTVYWLHPPRSTFPTSQAPNLRRTSSSSSWYMGPGVKPSSDMAGLAICLENTSSRASKSPGLADGFSIQKSDPTIEKFMI